MAAIAPQRSFSRTIVDASVVAAGSGTDIVAGMLLRPPPSTSTFSRAEIAAHLRLLAEQIDGAAEARDGQATTAEDTLILGESAAHKSSAATAPADIARLIYTMRRRRRALFGSDDLFGEPAWDLLLDLFIAARQGKRVPVTSACIGAAVPLTTALRWLNQLEQRGLIMRDQDPSDARRTYVRITATAEAELDSFLTQFAAALAVFSLQTDSRPKAPAPA